MPTRARLLLLAPLLLALAACATEDAQRRVRAEFSCDDGRQLRVTFLPETHAAILHVTERDVPMAAEPDQPGRAFTGSGFEMHGVGDSITFTSPPSTRCVETR